MGKPEVIDSGISARPKLQLRESGRIKTFLPAEVSVSIAFDESEWLSKLLAQYEAIAEGRFPALPLANRMLPPG